MITRGGLGETERQTVDGMSDEQPQGGGVPPAVLLFQPKYRLGHPENYLFLLSKNIFTGSKYQKKKKKILKKETLASSPFLWPGSTAWDH